ncbi:hypothetical protein MRX96_034299 [Rhipicephalus microplus]
MTGPLHHRRIISSPAALPFPGQKAYITEDCGASSLSVAAVFAACVRSTHPVLPTQVTEIGKARATSFQWTQAYGA